MRQRRALRWAVAGGVVLACLSVFYAGSTLGGGEGRLRAVKGVGDTGVLGEGAQELGMGRKEAGMERVLSEDSSEDVESGEYPPDAFTAEQRRNGAWVLHFVGMLYMFILLSIVSDEFFVPALERIVEVLDIPDDVAGATFMAAGGSAPELATSFVGTFLARSNVGLGTIVGSATFNVLFVIGMCGFFSPGELELTWWPLFRDSICYSVSILVLYFFFQDGQIEWWEALIQFLWYLCYVLINAYNETCYQFVLGIRTSIFGAKQGVSPSPTKDSNSSSSPAVAPSAQGEKLLEAGSEKDGKHGSGVLGDGDETPRATPAKSPLSRGQSDGALPRGSKPPRPSAAGVGLKRAHMSFHAHVLHNLLRDEDPFARNKKRTSLNKAARTVVLQSRATDEGRNTLQDLIDKEVSDEEGGKEDEEAGGSGGGSGGSGGSGGKKDKVEKATVKQWRRVSGMDIAPEALAKFREAQAAQGAAGVATTPSTTAGTPTHPGKIEMTAVDADDNLSDSGSEHEPAATAAAETDKGEEKKEKEKEKEADAPIKKDVEEVAKEDEQEEESTVDDLLRWPSSARGRVWFILTAPIVFPMAYTIPDTRKDEYKDWFPLTFVTSILWIGGASYLMVWWATLVGAAWGVPPEIMGVTLLAAGTSVPDLITSVIVARDGLGDMAVSSSIGSNLFDSSVGLPVPWLIFALVNGRAVIVDSAGLGFSLALLFFMLIVVIIAIAGLGWKLSKPLSVTMFILYGVFLALTLLVEYGIIPVPFGRGSQSA